ncbi:MAG: hypothetical protein HIU85_06665 [Proteobacteria bacterium]|nr:hypothetical protein [Pseudomonadota bacterium]
MGIVDGHGYDLRGITGAFLADAIAGSCACILLAIVLRRWLFQPASVENPASSTVLSL